MILENISWRKQGKTLSLSIFQYKGNKTVENHMSGQCQSQEQSMGFVMITRTDCSLQRGRAGWLCAQGDSKAMQPGKPLNSLLCFRSIDPYIHTLVWRRREGSGLFKAVDARAVDRAMQRSRVVFLQSRKGLPVWGRLMCANCTENRHSNRL